MKELRWKFCPLLNMNIIDCKDKGFILIGKKIRNSMFTNSRLKVRIKYWV
jgi:hypothetical protein